jgi:hypothetical protein
VLKATLASENDLEVNKGKLRGKIVLLTPGPDLEMSMEPLGRRLTNADLANLAMAPMPVIGGRPAARPNARQSQTKIIDFLRQEAPLVIVRPGVGPSEGGTVFSGIGAGSWDPKLTPPSGVRAPHAGTF